MNAVNPVQCARRSMLYRWHERHEASFVEHAGAIVVANYAADAAELAAARELGLCDLSTLPRWGVTGRGATASLTDVGLRRARQTSTVPRGRSTAMSWPDCPTMSTCCSQPASLVTAEPPAGFPYRARTMLRDPFTSYRGRTATPGSL